MQTVMYVFHKTLQNKARSIVTLNPTMIPRKGDRIMLGFVPAPTVTDVLWEYEANQTKVTVIVD